MSKGCQHVQLKPPGGRRAVDALVQADERHADDVQLVQERDQVPEVAPKSVEADYDEHVETIGSIRWVRTRPFT